MTRGMSDPRVGVLAYQEIGACPDVINGSIVWARHGYAVDLLKLSRPDEAPIWRGDADRVRIHSLSLPYEYSPLIGILNRLQFVRTAFRIFAANRYRCLIGLNADALIAATIVGKRLRIPVIYHSYDIELTKNDRGLPQKARKALERWCHRRVLFSIAQNEARANLLRCENRIPSAPVYLVPCSPLDASRCGRKKEYLIEVFKAPALAASKVVLYHGGMSQDLLVDKLVESVQYWPEGYVLALHGRGPFSFLKQIERKIADLGPSRIMLSTRFLPYEELDRLAAGADLGVALYRNVDLNKYTLFSTKIFLYLKASLPVITVDFPTLRALIADTGAGCCLRTTDPDQIADAVKHILGDGELHSRMSIQAKAVFEEHEFGRHYARVIRAVEEAPAR